MSLQAEASRLADRYVEERGRIASRQASATYESAAAVPARVKRAFQAFDADHSGYLDYKELANALRFYGVDVSHHGAAGVLAAYDDRPDGRLDLVEFSQLVRDAESGALLSKPLKATSVVQQHYVGAVPRRITAAFEVYDRDGSGYLDARELRAALRHLGIDVSTAKAANVLRAYDELPDGRLDVVEFWKLVRDVKQGGVWAAQTDDDFGASSISERVAETFEYFDRDCNGYLDRGELREALRHYGIDVSNHAAAAVLSAYDDHPDGRLELHEFANLVRDAERGFVLGGSPACGSAAVPASAASSAPSVYTSRKPLIGLGSNTYNHALPVATSSAWPHHRNEEERMRVARCELESGGAVRDGLLRKEAYWKGNGAWVRRQLLSEVQSRKDAEADAKVARAEAAAAIARVEALQAAAAARELEIEAAAARLDRHRALDGKAEGAGAEGSTPSTARMGKERMAQLVCKLENNLLEKLDQRARGDSESARAQVLSRVFKAAPIGGPRSERYATRAEFADAMALLGLPQAVTSVQKTRPPPSDSGSGMALPEVRSVPKQREDIESAAWIDKAVVNALFDKYSESAPGAPRKPPPGDPPPEKLIDYVSLYSKVARAATTPGQSMSAAMAHSNYMDALEGRQGPFVADYGVFGARRHSTTQARWAAARARMHPKPGTY